LILRALTLSDKSVLRVSGNQCSSSLSNLFRLPITGFAGLKQNRIFVYLMKHNISHRCKCDLQIEKH